MPRWSKHVALPGGGYAIVCGSSRTRKCSVCKTRPATQECDYVVGHLVDTDADFNVIPGAKAEPATCDQPLCRACAVHPSPGVDHCPDHQPRSK